MAKEARLQKLDSGLAPVTDGWFVVNVRDAAWETNDHLGAMCAFEGESAPSPTSESTSAFSGPEGEGCTTLNPHRRISSSWPVNVSCSSRTRSGRSRHGTSCTARQEPSTRSLRPQIARASSSWRAHRAQRPREPPSSTRAPSSPSATESASRLRRDHPERRNPSSGSRHGATGGRTTGTRCPGRSSAQAKRCRRITSSQGQQTRVIAASLASLEAAGLTDTVAALRGNFLQLGKR
jgi:hypothetical protein